MTYAINPNAKDVWIRDNEDTMDLSPITDASTVYLENGRTIEQELGEGSMVSNIATVDNSMSKIIDGTLDGAYESCVLKGRSLVNLCDGHSSLTDNTNVYTMFSNGIYTYSAKEGYDGSIAPAYILTINMIQRLTAGKTYTVLLTQLDNNDCRFGIATRREDWSGVIVYSEPNSSTDCVRKFKFTLSSEDYTNVELRLVNCVNSVSSIRFKDVMIIEGDYIDKDIPFFTGLCDVKMPILHNVSSEAFCHDSLEGGTISGSGGGNTSSTTPRARTKDMKKLNGATSILFSDNLLGVEKYVFSYDSNKRYLGRTPTNWETGNEIKPVEGAYYYRVVFTKYLEELPHSMYIIPKNHKTNILHTSEEVVLRSLPNGVKDTYNVITGEYVKRIGEVVLDGSDIIFSSQAGEVAGDNVDCRFATFYNAKISSLCVADKIRTSFYKSGLVNEEILMLGSNCLIISIKKDRLGDLTVNEFLKQNPITVQYELATPVTKTVSPIGVPFAYENGHVILESGYEGQSLLPTLEYSTVVNKTGQVQSVAKTIMKQEEQLSSLEKMLTQSIVEMDYNNTLLTLNLEIDEVM